MARDQQMFRSGGVSIAVEIFEPEGLDGRRPAILMLHGADGLGNPRYRIGARHIASAGYQVYLVHYLDRTGERRASFATVFQNFLPWMQTVRDGLGWVSGQPAVDPDRIGIIGISLGAALGLWLAAEDRRIRALVDYFGPFPHGMAERTRRLPPTLILHGAADPIVPAANAHAIENLARRVGAPVEIMVYPGQGHSLHGGAEADANRRVASFLARYLRREGARVDPPLSASG